MPNVTLTDEQVVELVEQLPVEKQEQLLRVLLRRYWPEWDALSRYGVQRARETATRQGSDWDAMSEEEQEAFIDRLVHEGPD